MNDRGLKTRFARHDPYTVEVARAIYVYEEMDKTEGRSGRTLRHVTRDPEVARRLAAGLGVMGQPGHTEAFDSLVLTFGATSVSPEMVVAVPLSLVRLIDNDATSAIARAALARLSPEEAEAVRQHFARVQRECESRRK